MTWQEKSVKLSNLDMQIKNIMLRIVDNEKEERRLEREIDKLEKEIEKHQKMNVQLSDAYYGLGDISSNLQTAVGELKAGYSGAEAQTRQGELSGYQASIDACKNRVESIINESVEEMKKKLTEKQEKKTRVISLKKIISDFKTQMTQLKAERKRVESIIVDEIF